MKKWLAVIASLVMLVAVLSGNFVQADSGASAPAGDTVIVRAYFPNLEMAHKVVISFEAETLESEYEKGYLVMEVTQDQIAVLTDLGFQVEVDDEWMAQQQQRVLPLAQTTGIPG